MMPSTMLAWVALLSCMLDYQGNGPLLWMALAVQTGKLVAEAMNDNV